jgi:ADP-heptose:LPS heptosyltransferase
MRKIILRNRQAPGDVVVMTGALRDLHRLHPGRYQTDVRTPYPDLWRNNPHLTTLDDGDDDVRVIDLGYPTIHRSNTEPRHVLQAFTDALGDWLGLRLHPTEFRGDLHLDDAERTADTLVARACGRNVPYWVLVAGGKRDFTAKIWATDRFQAVVDRFAGRIAFVQVGAAQDDHPELRGVVDLRGRTTLRALLGLIYRAQGVLTPVSLAMHLAAAVETTPSGGATRACVVIAGGREPAHWEAYPQHQFLHRNGMLPCCAMGGCWRSRVRALGDGSEHDAADRLCTDVVDNLPRCLDLVSVDDVCRAIELYLAGRTQRALDADDRIALASVLTGAAARAPARRNR